MYIDSQLYFAIFGGLYSSEGKTQVYGSWLFTGFVGVCPIGRVANPRQRITYVRKKSLAQRNDTDIYHKMEELHAQLPLTFESLTPDRVVNHMRKTQVSPQKVANASGQVHSSNSHGTRL